MNYKHSLLQRKSIMLSLITRQSETRVRSLKPKLDILLSVVCLLIVLGFQSAQGQVSEKEIKGKQFTCMYWNGMPSEELFYKQGETFLPMEFTLSKRSKPHALKDGDVFSIHRKLKTTDGEAEQYQIVGQAPMITGTNRILFIIFEMKKESGLKLRIMAIDDSVQAFPVGTYRFVNFCNAPLVAKFDKATRKIPAGKITLMKPNVPTDGGYLPFFLGNSKGKVIYENRFYVQPRGRKIVFIGLPRAEGQLPQVRFLSQIISQY